MRNLTLGLFQNANVNAIAALTQHAEIQNVPYLILLTHIMTAGTIASTTFKIRCGMETAGTITFNGVGGIRKLGGVANSSLIIQEFA